MRVISIKSLLFTLLVILIAGGSFLLVNKEEKNPRTWPEALEQYAGTPEYKSVDPKKSLNKQTSIFEIAGRTFEMPTVYIQSNLGGKRQQPEGVNLLYVLPDYTSRADFENKAAYKQAFNAGRFAHMMFEPSIVRPPFDTMLKNRRRNLTKIEHGIPIGTLKAENWYRRDGDEVVLRYQVFIEQGKAGNVVSFIECDPTARFPGCTHRFRDKGLLYVVYYNMKNYFAKWQEQRQLAINFIDSFEIEEQSHQTEE